MNCKQCREHVAFLDPNKMTGNEIAFCDDVCLNNWLCEHTPPTREDTLDAVEFQRQYEEVI